MKRRLFVLPLAVAALATLVAAQAIAHPHAEALEASQVEATSVMVSSSGVLIGERTAITTGFDLDAGRSIHVRAKNGGGVKVKAHGTVREVAGSKFMVLDLAHRVNARPMPLSEAEPLVGDVVFLLLRDRGSPEGYELAEVKVTMVSRSRLELSRSGYLPWGTPVVDADGALMGLSAGSSVARIGALLDVRRDRPRSVDALPHMGLRIGGAWGSNLSSFLFQYDFGVVLWDRLALVGRVGLGGVGNGTRRVAGFDYGTLELGKATETEIFGGHGGFEARYRVLLTEDFPAYLELAAGFHMGMLSKKLKVEGETVASADDLTYALSVGADIKVWGAMIGYRFMPELLGHNISNTHQFTVGFTLF